MAIAFFCCSLSKITTWEVMKEDLLPFLAGVGLLVLYLIWSAKTEMGTRWPWRK
ncbi:hypothetical protein ACQQ5V_06545 [Synechocystis sp. PCC 6803]|uniref:hypothetical protein n=1 Tax=Synechocystis sp. PCC 6803 TaxID=1148 RepID=UPI000304C7D7|nr:hypothetical protein [Synechocystis sp. PCC 6803]MBD2618571.1 hypothetical protein [Synechocystis sp. FACHB-898]MBD2661046.1 hypothetical protein [Synechocystis sp. FACHB-929]NHL97329.1 hypothetical protein [Synechocystis sp. PCC 6803]